jgi:ABC-type polysaccharide/polyol phosphate export permease
MSDAVHMSRMQPRAGLSELWQYRALMKNLVVRELRVRHKQSVLGIAWTMLSPLIMISIMALVFSQFFGDTLNGVKFPVYALSGLVPWTLFSSASASGLVSLIASGGIIRRIYVPKPIFPIAAVGSCVVNFSFSGITLLGYMLVARAPVGWNLLLVLIPALEIAVFSLGVALALSTMNVFFRDVKWFYDSLLLAWFYATPIFYPPDIIGSKYLTVMKLNPLWPMLRAFRQPILNGAAPASSDLALGGAFALVSLVVGWWTLRLFEQDIVNYL